MRVHRGHANQVVETIGKFTNLIDAVDDNVQVTEKQRRAHGYEYGKRRRIGLLAIEEIPAKPGIKFIVELYHMLELLASGR